MKKEDIITALKNVQDPEIGIDIWTLGLIYSINESEQGCTILMTLTTPFCPFADQLIADVESQVGKLYDNREGCVKVELTFEPAWEPPKELRSMLGI